jgi:hypothetical protein
MVRDEKMPAFVDHSNRFRNQVTVFYLPNSESISKFILLSQYIIYGVSKLTGFYI